MKMKKKNGFTLIEIIICIGMLAVIAVGSIVGIHLVNKNLIIKELNQITNKAIQAAQVYIETNKEAQNQLYAEQNAVKIPIKVLVNEGLLSLKGTKLDNSKIKNEYVITALSTESGNSTECTNIDSKASWDNDKVIYICTNLNSKGEVTGSNLATIDPNTSSNRIKASQEPYYFKGAVARNYVKYGDKLYRIYYIDTDDTLILYSEESFGNTFNGKILPISSYSVGTRNSNTKNTIYCNGVDNIPRLGEEKYSSSSEGETAIDDYDVVKTSYCVFSNNTINVHYPPILDAWMKYSWDTDRSGDYYIATRRYGGRVSGYIPYAYKIHLNSSFKLGSGTGDYANPYILEEK